MKIKQVKNFSVGLLLVLLTSCSGMEETMRLASEQTKNARDEFARKNPEQTQNNNSNIVKVLDRVSCIHYSEYPECPPPIAERIWKICLDKGYTTSTPDREVISARDLKELVKGESPYEGYCIGSEYITK